MIEPEVDPLALREFEPEFQVKARDLPELFDVLDLDEYPQPLASVEQRLAAARPEVEAGRDRPGTSTVTRVQVEVPELIDEVIDSEHMTLHAVAAPSPVRQPPAAALPVDATPLPRRQSDDVDDAPEPALPNTPRSRLMRMKERGLFKNE